MLIANKSSQQVLILLCRFSQPPASTGNSTQPMGILLHINRLGRTLGRLFNVKIYFHSNFVDVIHTNAGVYGKLESCGHMGKFFYISIIYNILFDFFLFEDVYMNNGQFQVNYSMHEH